MILVHEKAGSGREDGGERGKKGRTGHFATHRAPRRRDARKSSKEDDEAKDFAE